MSKWCVDRSGTDPHPALQNPRLYPLQWYLAYLLTAVGKHRYEYIRRGVALAQAVPPPVRGSRLSRTATTPLGIVEYVAYAEQGDGWEHHKHEKLFYSRWLLTKRAYIIC